MEDYISDLQYVAGQMQEEITEIGNLILTGHCEDFVKYRELCARRNAMIACQSYLNDKDKELKGVAA